MINIVFASIVSIWYSLIIVTRKILSSGGASLRSWHQLVIIIALVCESLLQSTIHDRYHGRYVYSHASYSSAKHTKNRYWSSQALSLAMSSSMASLLTLNWKAVQSFQACGIVTLKSSYMPLNIPPVNDYHCHGSNSR